MATGIRVYNQYGQLRLDYTDRVTRLVSTVVVAPFYAWPPNNHQFYSIPGMTNDGTWMISFSSMFYKAQIENGGFRIWCESGYNDGGLNSYPVPVSIFRV